MKKNISISDAELPIMKVLWENGTLTSPQILEKLEGNKNTLKTLLQRLVTKGAISVEEPMPRKSLYTAAVSKEEYIKVERTGFIQKVFDGSAKNMLLNFVQEEKISKQDLQELLALIEEE